MVQSIRGARAWRSIRRLLALVPLGLVVACGGGRSAHPAAHLIRGHDRASVVAATSALTRAALNGGDPFQLTLNIAVAIRQARLDGVAPSWISRQVDEAEAALSECSPCLDLLSTLSARV